jgi:murein DD-endopeptidase MepM/ murein hydrolase activator NlpD
VTGPHLHWAARYGTITVNPLDLVALGRDWYAAPRPTARGGAINRSAPSSQLSTLPKASAR